MAEQKNRILIEVELDQDAAKKKAVELTKALEAQRAELAKNRKLLRESGGENEEAAEKVAELSREIKATSQELRGYQREAVSVSNSTEALRIEAAKLAKEQKNVDTSTEEGRKKFKELEEQLKANREQTNENSIAAGSFKDNVGNYTASIQKALGINVDFTQGLGGMADGFKNATSSAKAFRIALLATGIGVIVTLITAFFTQTSEGRAIVERLGAVFRGVFGQIAKLSKQVFGSLKKFFEGFSKDVTEFFQNPLENSIELVKNLGASIVENIVNRVEGLIDSLGLLGKAISEVFSGEFDKAKESAKELAVALGQTISGATKKNVEEFGEGVAELGNGFADAVAQADRLTLSSQRLRRVIREQNEEAANQQRIAEENRKLRDDETRSLSERLALNANVLKSEEARRDALKASIEAQKQIIQNDIAIAGGQATDEQLDELSAFRTELLLIEEDFAGRTTEVLTEANAIRKEELRAQANFEKALLEEKLITESLNAEEKLKQKLAILAKEREAELVGLREGSIERQQTIQEFRNKELALRKEFSDQVQEQLKARLDAELSLQAEQTQKQLAIEKGAADERKAIAQAQEEIKRQQLGNAKQATDTIISLFGEETKAGKAAFIAQKGIAIAETIIAGQQAIAKIQSTYPPPISTAFSIAQAVSTGLQIAKIASTNIGSKGGSSGGGDSASTGGEPASSGSSQVGKQIAGVLGSPTAGNAPTSQNSGLTGRQSTSAVSQLTLSGQLLRALEGMPPPVVSVDDFTTVQNRVKVIDSLTNQ